MNVPANPPRVTVVMPVYNSEPHLREAIASVLAQTMADFEFLVADDVSRDGSCEVVRSFAGDRRIRFWRNPSNRGIFGNLNGLCREARAPLIKIACADDVLLPNCLERQAAFMDAHPAIAFCRCHGTESSYAAARPPLCFQPELPQVIHPAAAALAFFTFGNIPGNLTNVMMRAAAWRDAGGFSETLPYVGDMDMWTRLSARHPFGIQPDALVMVRRHGGQASVYLNRRNELLPQADRVYDACFALLPVEFRRRIRWGFALYHGDFWVRDSVKRMIRGKWAGLGPLWRRRSFSVGVWWWFLSSLLHLKAVFGAGYIRGNLARIAARNRPAEAGAS